MGDYSKLIVACTVKASASDELKNKIEELGLGDSAYQSQERVISIEPTTWRKNGALNLVLVGQTKYGRGQSEFCEWLRPHVIQGSGEDDVFAISFSEYCSVPRLWKLREQLK